LFQLANSLKRAALQGTLEDKVQKFTQQATSLLSVKGHTNGRGWEDAYITNEITS